jgi:sugar phosphate isomerase/epimerase
MRIGALAVGDTPDDVAVSLAAAARAGFECAQLYVRRPVDDAGWAAVLASAREHALPPVAMGGYVNPLDPALPRDEVLDQLRAFIRRAAGAGIPLVVTWSGSRAKSVLGGHPATHEPTAWDGALSSGRQPDTTARVEAGSLAVVLAAYASLETGTLAVPEDLGDVHRSR